jgi:hypothetical protein
MLVWSRRNSAAGAFAHVSWLATAASRPRFASSSAIAQPTEYKCLRRSFTRLGGVSSDARIKTLKRRFNTSVAKMVWYLPIVVRILLKVGHANLCGDDNRTPKLGRRTMPLVRSRLDHMTIVSLRTTEAFCRCLRTNTGGPKLSGTIPGLFQIFKHSRNYCLVCHREYIPYMFEYQRLFSFRH